MPRAAPPSPSWKLWATRIAWFVILWCAGLGAVSLLAYVLRLWIAPR